MSPPDGYATPGAFRRALTDRLKALAAEGRWTLPQLQRQIAYDRLLERLYLVDEGWVVKGATALLTRELGMRATVEIDLYRAAARDQAEADVRRAAGMDLGDWFRFEVGPAQQLTPATPTDGSTAGPRSSDGAPPLASRRSCRRSDGFGVAARLRPPAPRRPR